MGNNVQIIFQAIDKASKEIDGIKNAAANLDKQASSSDSSIGNFGKQLANVGKIAVGITGSIAAVGFAMKQVYDFGEAGASLLRLEEASGNLAASLGSNMDEVVSAVSKASLGMVSEMDIMQASSRAMMLGVSSDSAELANLMEIAASKARAMGISTTQAFNDIVTGIGRGSPLILDNLGIVINATETNKAYAESIGKTAEQLTEAEKTQALLNSVLTEGNKQLEAVGGLTLDAASSFEVFAANSKDAGDRLKKNLAPVMAEIVDMLNRMMFGLDGETTALLASADAIKNSGVSRQEQLAALNELIAGTDMYVNSEGDLVRVHQEGYRTITELVAENFLYLESVEALPASVDALTQSQSMANDVLAANYDHIAELATGNRDLAAAQQAAADTAGQQQLATLNLAEALKGATRVEFAKAFLDQLANMKNISSSDLAAMSEDVMLHFGIINERSIAGADGITKLTEGLDNGATLAVPLGDALDIINRETADGILDWPILKDKLFEVEEPITKVTGKTDNLTGSMTNLNEQLPPATEGAIAFTDAWKVIESLNHKQYFKIKVEQEGGGVTEWANPNKTIQTKKVMAATGLEGTVPAGYGGDSFPIFTSSSEKVTVQTPTQKFETDQRYETIISMLAAQRPATAAEIGLAVRDAIMMIPG